MNEQAVQLITNLNGGGRNEEYIINTLVNSPQYNLDRSQAEQLVYSTLNKNSPRSTTSAGTSVLGSSRSTTNQGQSTFSSGQDVSSSGQQKQLPKTIAQSSQTETNLSLESEEDNALELSLIHI